MLDAIVYVLNSVPDALVLVDAEGRIVFANGQAEVLFGYPRDGLVGQAVEVLLPEEYGGSHASYRTAYFEAPQHRRMGQGVDLFARRRDGTCFPVDISLSPMVLGGEVLAMAAVRDRTERHRLQQELKRRGEELSEANQRLRELDRLKSEFLALMSHELRTPLNAVIGFTSLVLDEVPGPINDEQKRQLGYAHRSGTHLLSLINDLIEVSRLEGGYLELHPEEVSLPDVVSNVIDTLSGSASQKGIRLRADDVEGTVVCDRQRLLQVLINLVANAVKFTDRGEVRVRSEIVEGQALIHVSDTGIGIPADKIPQLFKPFQQLDTGRGRKYEGTGLGLYLCQRLAALMHGKMGVTSAPERGSTFTLRIPVRPGEEPSTV